MPRTRSRWSSPISVAASDGVKTLLAELTRDTVHCVGGVPVEQTAMTEPWALVDEVAKPLGAVKDSIYRWIEKRGLPVHKIGRLWKCNLSEVGDWVRKQDASVSDEEHRPQGDK